MALFEVPGWSIGSGPVTATSSQVSKKRKRPLSHDVDKIHSAEINLEKLVKRLKTDAHGEADGKRTPGKHAGQGEGGKRKKDKQVESGKPVKQKKQEHTETEAKGRDKGIGKGKSKERVKGKGKGKEILESEPALATDSRVVQSSLPSKKNKRALNVRTQSAASHSSNTPSSNNVTLSPTLTPFQKEMKQSLDGARFRLINETLYKTNSTEAHQMMRDDPQIYEDYHKGFRHQVLSWPTNPVSHYISILSKRPLATIIADLGCGDAALARALTPKGYNVISFDLVSNDPYVVEADICEKVPLPGSEGMEDISSDGEGHVVDVVVCALSLMGVNWPKCIRESWRILKPGGELKIAEVASRFTDIEEFVSLIGSIGFRLKSKDDGNTHFTLFEFTKAARKMKTSKEWLSILSKGEVLKPCEYKRR